jgi:hypothetical protein
MPRMRALVGCAVVTKPAYTRLETDDEFISRIAPSLDGWARSYMNGLRGDQLDTYVWDVRKLQRKIIEVYP